jgi:hypothetical protein
VNDDEHIAGIKTQAAVTLGLINDALNDGVSQARLMTELTLALRESGLLGEAKLPFGLG